MSCVVCGHASRAEVEAAAGEPKANLFDVAVRFGVTASALARHVTKHSRADVTTSPAAAGAEPDPTPRRRTVRRAPRQGTRTTMPVAAPPSAEDDAPATSRSEEISVRRGAPRTAREKVERLVDSLQRISDRVDELAAAGRGEPVPVKAQLDILRAMVGPLRLLGTFTGEIGASETAVASSAFYKRTRSAIVEALRPFPDAARAVIAALERVERGETDRDEAAA